ncbi:Ig-like domain-containing protein [Mycolicibacterium sp. XJ1819]
MAPSADRRAQNAVLTAVFSYPHSTYARHIGRVGALAVALGVGIAVASGNGAGIARADNTSGADGTSAASDPSAPSMATATDPSGESPAGHTDNQAPTDDDVSGQDPDDEVAQDLATDDPLVTIVDDDVAGAEEQPPTSTPPAPSEPGEVSAPTTPQSAPPEPDGSSAARAIPTPEAQIPDPAPAAEGPDAASVEDTPAFSTLRFSSDDDIDAPELFTTTTTTTVDETGVPDVVDIAPTQTAGVATGLVGTIVNVATTVVGALLSPFIGSGPDTPADPPLLWAVLAFVRREITRTFFNTSPDAVADLITTSEDTPITIDVLGNDVDDDTLSVTAVTQPANGTVVVNPDGTITYTPNPDFSGSTDTFTYTVSDAEAFHLHGLASLFGGGKHTDTATVTVSVTPANDAPVANDDTYTVGEDGVLVVPASTGVLVGDTDVDNTADQLTAILVAPPMNGTLDFNADGSFTYTPLPEYSGPDSFTYQVTDGVATSNVATVTITVGALNDPPVANDDTATVDEGGSATITVTANDTDADGKVDVTTVTITREAEFGTATVDPVTGVVTYVSTATGVTSDSFEYTVEDNSGAVSSPATVHITIVSAAPLDIDQLRNLLESGVVEVSANGDGTIRVIDGQFIDVPVRNSAEAAQVLNRVAELLGASANFAAEERITDLAIEGLDGSAVGAAHFYSLRQEVNGIPVVGSEVVLVTDHNGAVTGVFSMYDTDITAVDTTPDDSFGVQDATDTAVAALLNHFGDLSDAERDELVAGLTSQADLVVYNADPSTSPRLAWRVTLSTDPSVDDPQADLPLVADTYYLYANGWEVGTLFAETSAMEAAAASTSETAPDALGNDRPITVEVRENPPFGNTYVLRDVARKLEVYRAQWYKEGRYIGTRNGQEITKDLLGNWDRDGVSALANAAAAHDLYKRLDPNFLKGVMSTIRFDVVGNGLDNAIWTGTPRIILAEDYAAGADIVGHELTHAVIQAVMTYKNGSHIDWLGGNTEANALNEAYADIMGGLIEASVYGDSQFSIERWRIGEALWDVNSARTCAKVACALRDMAAPDSQDGEDDYRTHYRQLGADEYENSTIFTHAAYLMMTDSATTEVSDSMWAKVFYNSLGAMPSNADYRMARYAVINQARAVGFDASAINAIKRAFDDVGIAGTPVVLGGVFLPGAPEGNPYGTAGFNADGTRALVTTLDYDASGTPTSYLALIDPFTGERVGSTLGRASNGLQARFTPDGQRVVVLASEETATGSYLTTVTVIDAQTGAQIGTPVPLAGGGQLSFNDTGTRAAVTADEWSSATNTYATRLVLIDTATGQQVGDVVTVTGSNPGGVQFNPTGTRALITIGLDEDNTKQGQRYEVTVVDAVNGGRLGDVVDLSGDDNLSASLVFTADGTRAVYVTSALDPSRVSRVTVIDTATGQQRGATFALDGHLTGSFTALLAIPETDRIVAMTREWASSDTTYVSIVDAATGTQVGTSLVLPDSEGFQTLLSDNGTRAVIIHRSTSLPTPTTWMTVVDTASATQVGQISVLGNVNFGGHLNADGTLATVAVMTDVFSRTTRLATIDTMTGEPVGEIVSVPGGLEFSDLESIFDGDGDRAIVTTVFNNVIRAAVFDATTGTQIGTTVTLPENGVLNGGRANEDGTRATITQWVGGDTRVSVIDMTTGALIGEPVVISGNGEVAQFTADGTRAVVSAYETTFDPDTGASTEITSVAVIDVFSGMQVGQTYTLLGRPYADMISGDHDLVQLNTEGTRAIVTTGLATPGAFHTAYTTEVTVIDMSTGAQIGETFSVAGQMLGLAQIDPQGGRATITTMDYHPGSSTTSTRVVVVDLTLARPVGATLSA